MMMSAAGALVLVVEHCTSEHCARGHSQLQIRSKVHIREIFQLAKASS